MEYIHLQNACDGLSIYFLYIISIYFPEKNIVKRKILLKEHIKDMEIIEGKPMREETNTVNEKCAKKNQWERRKVLKR